MLQKVSYDRAFHADCDTYNDFDMYPNILDHRMFSSAFGSMFLRI